MTANSHPQRGINRRRLLGQGGFAVAGVVAGAPLAGSRPSPASASETDPSTRSTSKHSQRHRIPQAARPGGSYDQYVADLAAKDQFSGVVRLTYRGRTVLSRSYGMADKDRGIRNSEDVAFVLSSASQPFLSVAVMQLIQRGRLKLSDTVGTHLRGFSKEISDQVNIHHLLTTTSGLSAPDLDPHRRFDSRKEVHDHYEKWTRQTKLVHAPGSANQGHTDSGGAELAIAAQIVEAVSGTTYWDYVHKHMFRPAGMTRSWFYTRDQWLADRHIAHAYMRQRDGSRVDAARNVDTDSLSLQGPGENPARGFIGYSGGNAFSTAADLTRFAQALYDGTLLARPFVDVLTSAKLPGPEPRSFEGYTMPISIVRGPQWLLGRGGGTGGAGANWNIYPDTGWVGVVLTNHDDVPLPDILQREVHAITGEPIRTGGGGG